VKFKEKTAAEAMTLLGLAGSTILVWGNVTNSRSGAKFVTRFSYEFGYPSNTPTDEYKQSIHNYLQNTMSSGLFHPIRTDTANFTEQMTPTVLFILAMSAMTVRSFENARKFVNALKEYCNSEPDLIRRRELGRTYVECQNMELHILRTSLSALSYDLAGNIEKSAKLAREILVIIPSDYDAHLTLAYYYDVHGDRPNAEHHERAAEQNAPRGASAHHFNAAYFSLVRGEYEEALKRYARIPEPINAEPIPGHMNKKFLESGDPAMLFGDGFIEYKWRDNSIGRKQLQRFIDIADKSKHVLLVQVAEDLLNRPESN
jgi:tetratricopeptide (TPR) repeat protein